jgi:DNA modification methylase
MLIQQLPLTAITPYHKNPRKNDGAVDKVAQSITEFGFNQPIVVDSDMVIVVGHTRYKAAKKLNLPTIPVLVAKDISKEKLQAYRIADNKLNELAEWDDELLLEELQDIVRKLGDADLTGFNLTDMLAEAQVKKEEWKTLSEKFIVPPVSLIDGRSPSWLQRKKIWRDMGIRSEEGRDSVCLPNAGVIMKNQSYGGGVSIFDPVLTELLYLWYSPQGGRILDPFAGGSVRGIVAKMLGRNYTGIDLSKNQIEANKLNWQDLQTEGKDTLDRYKTSTPTAINWINGDSNVELDKIPNEQYDLVFTCPPYADLEVYSDDPNDISNMEYDDFVKVYSQIINKAAKKLKDNRFFVIVVGEVRSDDGSYYNFVGDTIKACMDAGLKYYNEAVFVTPYGGLMMRAEKPLVTSRKIVKTHQNALIFTKGKGKAAKEELEQLNQICHHNDETGELTDIHEKVLVFSKGNPKKATKDLGEIEIDDLSIISSQTNFDNIMDNLSKTFNIKGVDK